MSLKSPTFKFGPLERRSIVGGLTAAQALVCAAGALAGILTLDAAPTKAGALGALAIALGAAVFAFAPYGGRRLGEWLALLVAFRWRMVRRGARFRSPAPMMGRPCASSSSRPTASPLGSLRGIRVDESALGGRPVGVFVEDRGRRLSAVLACRIGGFTLLDPGVQSRRLQSWGALLAGLEGGAVRRLQWVERTTPAQGDELARWLYDERDPRLSLRGSAIVESYLELISGSSRVSQEHEILLALQIDGRRLRRRTPGGTEQLLGESLERLAQSLLACEIEVLGILTPTQLTRCLRAAFDPYSRFEMTTLDAGAAESQPTRPESPWPVAVHESWEHVQIDGALHATFWISAWPRREVSAMFMDALLGRSSAVRSVSACFEPLSPARAARDVEAAITRDRADRELRARFGQLETARHRQAQEAAVQREQELAVGHGEVRFTGFVTVSGRDQHELRRGCAEVVEHAARARLELRRMYGQQLEAFTYTLPICRGLR